MEYLIDGYNLLMALGPVRYRPGPGNLETARGVLLRWIADRAADPGLVTVVFDASRRRRAAGAIERHVVNGLAVLFAVGYPDADTLIAELCRRHSAPKRLVVVSNDREVQLAARRRKATALGCEAFVAALRRGVKAAQRAKQEKPAAPDAREREHWTRVFADSGAAEPAELPAGQSESRSVASHSSDPIEQMVRDFLATEFSELDSGEE